MKDSYDYAMDFFDKNNSEKFAQSCFLKDSFAFDLDKLLQEQDYVQEALNSKAVYMEVKAYDKRGCDGFYNMFEVYSRENGIKFTRVFSELFCEHTLKKASLLFESDKPIFEELLTMFGSHLKTHNNAIYGQWIDVMPYKACKYYRLDEFVSYKKVEKSNSHIMPKIISYYEVEIHSKDYALQAKCRHDTLDDGLDICQSILKTKENYKFLLQLPFFQKRVAKLTRLSDTLADKDHKKYFYTSDIYCE